MVLQLDAISQTVSSSLAVSSSSRPKVLELGTLYVLFLTDEIFILAMRFPELEKESLGMARKRK
jgi:hypothetical protein